MARKGLLAPPGKDPWITLSSEVVHRSEWNTLRVDMVVRPNGTLGTYDVLERPSGSQIIARTKNDEIFLVGQYRYPTRRWSWELPGGLRNKRESRIAAAKRELWEEIGAHARKWTHLGDLPLLCGTTPASVEVFVAEGIRMTEMRPAIEDGIQKVIAVPFPKVLELVRRGEIDNAPAVSSIFLYYLHR